MLKRIVIALCLSASALSAASVIINNDDDTAYAISGFFPGDGNVVVGYFNGLGTDAASSNALADSLTVSEILDAYANNFTAITTNADNSGFTQEAIFQANSPDVDLNSWVDYNLYIIIGDTFSAIADSTAIALINTNFVIIEETLPVEYSGLFDSSMNIIIGSLDGTTPAQPNTGGTFSNNLVLAAIPEPSSSFLIALAGLGLITRRKR
ncbi:PEP-CTERM sorting domain-containing protein [Akkermansiaceae bacterium]|nr:PEP-CTERM sorting domain-containing protein [Akkermansiaceae bacterium]